jgi:serine/threonine protein kinase/Tol biopolymer transport system component
MNSETPSRIGPYTIDREIGRGGMGVVYLGQDTNLGRAVAIKVLPAELATHPDRLARFEREARTMASLSHPNVAGIYGVEEDRGQKYLVLEFVEGENLADRLDRGALDVTEALELATQIAAGVEAAHDADVVHRDLKPANIIVTPEGQAKVLDFGLARTDEGSSTGTSDLSSAPTIAAAHNSPTMPGVILGTAAYMSPEQARGRRVDKRSDIWSFGVVLYEMLTSVGPFAGETATDSIGAILHKDVDLTRLPANTPPMVSHVLARCLQRDKSKRYRDIGDVRLELESLDAAATEQQVQSSDSSSRLWPMAAAAVAIVAILGWGMVLMNGGSEPRTPAISLSIPLGENLQVTGSMDISPDGRTLAFGGMKPNGDQQVYVRDLDDFKLREIAGSRNGENPFFSPDGKDLCYFARNSIYRVPVTGGNPIGLVEANWMAGGAWLDDDRIVYSEGVGSPLMVIPAGGGAAKPLTNLEDDPQAYAHVWPQHIRGTNRLVFTAWVGGPGGGARIMNLDTGEFYRLAGEDNAGRRFVPPMRWVASGHLILESWDAGLLSIPFDPKSTEPVSLGGAQQLLEGVYYLGDSTHSVFAVSEEGTAAYVPGYPNLRKLVWVDEKGNTELVIDQEEVEEYSRMGGSLQLSADGNRVLMGGSGEIVEVDLNRRIPRPVTSGPGVKGAGHWSADGSQVFFASNAEVRWSIWSVDSKAGSTPTMVLQHENGISPRSISPTGAILFMESTPGAKSDCWILEPDGTERLLLNSDADEYQPVFSPDGNWVAYASDMTGRSEVYAISASGDGSPVQISTQQGGSPKWARSGKTLYFRRGRQVMRIGIENGNPVGDPEIAFPAPNIITGGSYDITADEKRMIAVQLHDDAIPNEIRVITNFFDVIRNR